VKNLSSDSFGFTVGRQPNASVGVIVPTLNAASNWSVFCAALLKNVTSDQVLIIDSSSTDETAVLAKGSGFRVETISRSDFNHGATRQLGVNLSPDADILVFLTQDAELESGDAIARLCKAFDDAEVGAAYGRQLPRRGAGAIEAHARLFNYPAASQMKTANSQETVGFKSLFFSNSFGAYRRAALQAVGGFPEDVIFGEDTVTVAHLLQHGWKIAYVADATVRHSHVYSMSQEFRRYFDIGVLHSREAGIFAPFGEASGEGKKFVKSETAFVSRLAPHLLLSAWLRTVLKLFGYRLGRRERSMPVALKRRLSMSTSFWK
jgi:rhamnosyltransferase